MNNDNWPSLPLEAWQDTYDTLHMWAQIIGKVKLELCPHVNHWWETALYVSSRGLTTGPIPYGQRSFTIAADFIDHILSIRTDTGASRAMALAPRSVAAFHLELMEILGSLGLPVRINLLPKEVPDPIPFDQDTRHSSYDRDAAQRFWRALAQADRVLKRFRGEFIGKCSPVHFFWGSFDLAVTRFSGRTAPPRPEADTITREAYSHEVSSAGFWPGSGNIRGAAFYSYAAPEPAGFSSARVAPRQAFYNPPTKGFILLYDDVRSSPDPDRTILEFLQSTYETAANLGGWDRAALERASRSRRRAA